MATIPLKSDATLEDVIQRLNAVISILNDAEDDIVVLERWKADDQRMIQLLHDSITEGRVGRIAQIARDRGA